MRRLKVVLTLDDLVDDHPKWRECFNLLVEKDLPHTVGVVTEKYLGRETDWGFIKQYMGNGLTEFASHSRTHSRLPYKDCDSEVGGSKQDLVENLGVRVSSWIMPFGRLDPIILDKLQQYGYRVFRAGSRKTKPFRVGDLLKTQHSAEVGTGTSRRWSDVEVLNRNFDYFRNNTGFYLLMAHPEYVDWSRGGYVDLHLDYILSQSNVEFMTLGGWRNIVE